MSCLELNLILGIPFDRNIVLLGHISRLPEVIEALTVCKQLWIPINVYGFKSIAERVHINPKDAIIIGIQLIIAQSLLKSRRPVRLILGTKLPFVAEVSPRIFNHEKFLSLNLHNFQYGVGMATHQADSIFVLDGSCAAGYETIAALIALVDPLP